MNEEMKQRCQKISFKRGDKIQYVRCNELINKINMS